MLAISHQYSYENQSLVRKMYSYLAFYKVFFRFKYKFKYEIAALSVPFFNETKPTLNFNW